MSGFDLDVLVNVGYSFALVAVLMRDILWLRVFTVVASLIFIAYCYLLPSPLWPPIMWKVVFIAVNTYWIARLSRERRPVHFAPEEQRLYDTALRSLKPCHARALFGAAEWKTIQPGEQIVTEGQPLETLSLIGSGKFTIENDGIIVDEVGVGRFIGSYTFLKNVKGYPAPVTIIAAEESRLLVWQNDKLRDLIDHDTDFSMAVEASMGLELAQLLDHSRDDLDFALRVDRIARNKIKRASARRPQGVVGVATVT